MWFNLVVVKFNKLYLPAESDAKNIFDILRWRLSLFDPDWEINKTYIITLIFLKFIVQMLLSLLDKE